MNDITEVSVSTETLKDLQMDSSYIYIYKNICQHVKLDEMHYMFCVELLLIIHPCFHKTGIEVLDRVGLTCKKIYTTHLWL